MRPHQIFAAMSADHAEAFFHRLNEQAPGVFNEAVAAAATAMRARPLYLQKQPLPKRAAALRRALSRVTAGALGEEILAVYYLECRLELLSEWLDEVGLEHEDGALTDDDPVCPDPIALRKNVDSYRAKDDDPDRELLIRAFAAQTAIEWPDLDAIVEATAD